MPTLVANGVELSFVDEGQGTPVVFVHGVLSDHRAWGKQRAAVSARHRFIALDQRYFGPTPWIDDGARYALTTHADDLGAFTTALGLGPVHLVGWSYGGAIALRTAVSAPHLVRSLFLCEPVVPWHGLITDPAEQRLLDEDRQQLALAVDAARRGDLWTAARRFVEWAGNHDVGEFDRAVPAALVEMIFHNARTVPLLLAAPTAPSIAGADVSRLGCPIAIVIGERTRRTYQLLGDAIMRCLPGTRRIILPDAAHLAPWQNTPAFNAELLRFLVQADAGR